MVALHLLAEVAHVHVNAAQVAVEGPLPQVVHQLLAREDAPGACASLWRISNSENVSSPLAPAGDRAGDRVDLQVARAQRGGAVGLQPGAAQVGLHARHELAREKGLVT